MRGVSELAWHQAGLQRLQSWRDSGLDRCDPVRFGHIARLLMRAPSQTPAVQSVLADRVAQAMQAYEAQWQAAPSAPVRQQPGERAPVAMTSPLAQLSQYIGTLNRSEPAPSWVGEETVTSDMKSVRRFSQVWSHIAAEQQVKQALTRGPENAGPLNAHRLMLRSLALMQELSPDYLRRFLAQADSLLWIEQVNQKNALSDTRDKSKKTKVVKKA